jgi:hypothetical protein
MAAPDPLHNQPMARRRLRNEAAPAQPRASGSGLPNAGSNSAFRNRAALRVRGLAHQLLAKPGVRCPARSVVTIGSKPRRNERGLARAPEQSSHHADGRTFGHRGSAWLAIRRSSASATEFSFAARCTKSAARNNDRPPRAARPSPRAAAHRLGGVAGLLEAGLESLSRTGPR